MKNRTSSNPVIYSSPKKKHTLKYFGLIVTGSALVGLLLCTWLFAQPKRTPTSQQGQLIQHSKELTVVEFYSKTCPYCHKIGPTVLHAEIYPRLRQKANIDHVNVERHNKHDQRLFKKYDVQYTPTFMVFKNGHKVVINQHAHGSNRYQYVGTNKQIVRHLYRTGKVD